MIALEGRALRRLQLVELDLLKELDRICKKHGIRYCIIAGTLLGAVRHGGFIPWDDDADVAMLREDYERFREVCRTELQGTRYAFQDHQATRGYRWGYGKLRRTDTLFLREHQEHMPYPQGVFIDVFPMDAVPEHWLRRAVWNLGCFCIRKALWARVGKIADQSRLKRWFYRLLDRLPEAWLLQCYDLVVERSRRIHSQWVRILLFPTPNRQWAYRRCWYAQTRQVRFEDALFDGVGDPEAYLTFKFGNWRKLPPPSERKVHPVSAIRLPEEAGEEEYGYVDNRT